MKFLDHHIEKIAWVLGLVTAFALGAVWQLYRIVCLITVLFIAFAGPALATPPFTYLPFPTAPTISSGGCTSPAMTAWNADGTFEVTIGTSCTGVSTLVLGLPTAPVGWRCSATDITNNATNAVDQSGWATTTATLTSYSRTTGLALAWTASDVVIGHCTPL